MKTCFKFSLLIKRLFKNNQVFYGNSLRSMFKKNSTKIAIINFSILFNYLIYSKIYQKKIAKNYSKDYNYLLDLTDMNINDVFSKKTPKIFLLDNFAMTEEERLKVRDNFDKIHSKFNDLDSYVIKDLHCKETELLLEKYKINQNVLDKPFIFINKYGDVVNYSLDDFTENSKADSNFNFFEKMQILNNRHDLLLLNDHDYAFVVYLDTKNVDYSDPAFKAFRKIFFLLTFFNLKFFVATTEHSEFLEQNGVKLSPNNFYVIKRENVLDPKEMGEKLKFEKEDFKLVNLTDSIRFEENDNVFLLNVVKTLMSKINFVFYSSHNFKKKQGLEIFNLYFKNIPYYLYYTNLKDENNKKEYLNLMGIFKNNFDIINKQFVLVVCDNEKIDRSSLFKVFEKKTLDLREHTLNNVKFDETIGHYEPIVTKKLKIRKINEDSVKALIAKEDVSLDENYYFKKKLQFEKIRTLNYTVFDSFVKESEQNTSVILIKNKDDKFNRNSMERLDALSKQKYTGNIKFYHIVNSEENLKHMEKRFNMDFKAMKYPQLIVVKKNMIEIIPNILMLKYSITEEEIKNRFNSYLI